MRNIQTPVNIALGLAVAVLFILHFKGPSPSVAAGGKGKSDSAAAKPLKLAYVDLDSLQTRYEFFKQKMQELEKRRESAERDLNSAAQRLEGERNAFVQRGNSITQAEAENFQREFSRKMENLENQRKNLVAGLQQEEIKAMEELRKRINEFLSTYNTKHAYSFIFSDGGGSSMLFHKDSTLNITEDVVKGLNEAYAKSGSK